MANWRNLFNPWILVRGQDMDDSNGGLTVVSEHCWETLVKILSLADVLQKRKIFDLLHEFLEDSNWNYGSDDLEQVIFSLDWSPELQQKNLEYLDDNLDSWLMRSVRLTGCGCTTWKRSTLSCSSG